MEEALKALNIGTKVLAHRSNVMWNILLATEETVKALSSSVLTFIQTSTRIHGHLNDLNYLTWGANVHH